MSATAEYAERLTAHLLAHNSWLRTQPGRREPAILHRISHGPADQHVQLSALDVHTLLSARPGGPAARAAAARITACLDARDARPAALGGRYAMADTITTALGPSGEPCPLLASDLRTLAARAAGDAA